MLRWAVFLSMLGIGQCIAASIPVRMMDEKEKGRVAMALRQTSRNESKMPEELAVHIQEVQSEIKSLKDFPHAISFRASRESILTDGANKANATEAIDKPGYTTNPKYPAHNTCMKDEKHGKPFEAHHFQKLNRVLHWAQPWKYENATLNAYRKNATIKKVYYINGEWSPARKSFMEKQLRGEGVKFERWEAVSREEVSRQHVENTVPKQASKYSGKGMADYMKEKAIAQVLGTVGVYLSHATLLKHIAWEDKDGTDLYVIMEDDAALWKNWKESLLEKVKTLPADWDIARFVYWGGKRCEDVVPDSDWYEARGPPSLNKVSMYAGNQAYVVRPKSIKHILDTLQEMPVMDFDGIVGSNHKEGTTTDANNYTTSWTWGLHTYALKQPLGTHHQFPESSDRLEMSGFKTERWGDGSTSKNWQRS